MKKKTTKKKTHSPTSTPTASLRSPRRKFKTYSFSDPSLPQDSFHLPPLSNSQRSSFLQLVNEESEVPMALFDGFNDCILYFYRDQDGVNHAVYCYEDLVESFARKNHTTYLEAVEFIEYNTLRTLPYMYHCGDTPTSIPIIVYRLDRSFSTLPPSFFEKDYSDN